MLSFSVRVPRLTHGAVTVWDTLAIAEYLSAYCERIFDWPLMQEWTAGALAEPDEIIELEVGF